MTEEIHIEHDLLEKHREAAISLKLMKAIELDLRQRITDVLLEGRPTGTHTFFMEGFKIVYTGLRPGEKLHEELFHEMENAIPTVAPGVLLAAPRIVSYQAIIPILDELDAAAQLRDTPECLNVIRTLVPEYELTLASPAAPSARAVN